MAAGRAVGKVAVAQGLVGKEAVVKRPVAVAVGRGPVAAAGQAAELGSVVVAGRAAVAQGPVAAAGQKAVVKGPVAAAVGRGACSDSWISGC